MGASLYLCLLALLLCFFRPGAEGSRNATHLTTAAEGSRNATRRTEAGTNATLLHRRSSGSALKALLARGASAVPLAVTLLPRAFSYIFHFAGDMLVHLSSAIDSVFLLSKGNRSHRYNIVTISLAFIHDRLLSLSHNMFENEKTCLQNVHRLEALMDRVASALKTIFLVGRVDERLEARRRSGKQHAVPHFDIKSLSDRNSGKGSIGSSGSSGPRQHRYPAHSRPLTVDRRSKNGGAPRGAGYAFTTEEVILKSRKTTVASREIPGSSVEGSGGALADALSELYPMLWQWISNPLFDPTSKWGSESSVAAHLMLGLAVLACVCSVRFRSPLVRVIVVCFTMFAVWLTIVCLEQVYRRKELTKCSIDSVNNYFRSPNGSVYSDARISSDEGFEHSRWANSLLESLWTINGTSGGLGPYISKSMEHVLRHELRAVPRSVAHLQIDTFTLGTHPFVVRSVRVIGPRGGADSFMQAVKMHASQAAAGPATDGTIYRRLRSYVSSIVQPRSVVSNASIPDTSKVPSDNVIIDCDLAYVSRDMNIVLLVRSNDIMSVLHETKVKLSELAISGRVRLKVQLLEEYPFVGNATVSFVRLPQLDFALSTFGFYIHNIPGVYSWINVTMNWMFSKYTYPASGRVDLRELLCPHCGLTNITEILLQNEELLRERAGGGGGGGGCSAGDEVGRCSRCCSLQVARTRKKKTTRL